MLVTTPRLEQRCCDVHPAGHDGRAVACSSLPHHGRICCARVLWEQFECRVNTGADRDGCTVFPHDRCGRAPGASLAQPAQEVSCGMNRREKQGPGLVLLDAQLRDEPSCQSDKIRKATRDEHVV